MKDQLEKAFISALSDLGVTAPKISFEHPEILAHGDYATNVALAYAKQLGMKPRELAQKIVAGLKTSPFVEKVDIAGPGFINIHLSKQFFAASIVEIEKLAATYGTNTRLKGKRVLVEYTDPNPFKVFHIGHLMSNAIGESIARLTAASGAETIRANYQGDIGLHVAKAVWGMQSLNATLSRLEKLPEAEQVEFIGKAYVHGAEQYEADKSVAAEIQIVNQAIFDRKDQEINALYDWGRKATLDHFELIYKKLGTKFDRYFFESEVAQAGLEIVRTALGKGIFAESEGAIVFKGEDHGLHTRVFITSRGLPTYDAKELGLTKKKFDLIKPDISVVVTANEQNEYFKVVLRALFLMHPEMAERTKHVSHGMMRFASGKMSSRKGNVVAGEALLANAEAMVAEKIADRGFSPADAAKVMEKVAVGAIKYSVLKSAAGSDIVYDPEKAVSFDGDSGPYLQYSYARALSVLRKPEVAQFSKNAEAASAAARDDAQNSIEIGQLEKLLYRFPEVVDHAAGSFEPHFVTDYLTQLAGAFNAFYANNQIINPDDAVTSAYRLRLTRTFTTVMKNGLDLLAIPAVEKM